MNKSSTNSRRQENAPSGFSPFLKSSRKQLRVLAAGCVATGGVAAILLPGAAQNPAIVPAGKISKPQKSSLLAPLPEVNFDQDLPAAPDENEPIAEAAAPKRTLSQKQNEGQLISIDMRGGKVIDLIAMIAMQADLSISIGADVEEEQTIPYIRLTNVTPERAISEIAKGARLTSKKEKDGTFFVGKALPSPAQAKPRPQIIPAVNSFEDEPTWGDDEIDAQPEVRPRAQAKSLFPELVRREQTFQREARQMRPIRTRNVRPGILAWWIDPQHHPEPYEFAQAKARMAQDLNPNFLQPAVDVELYARMNNPTTAAPTLPFAQPYVPGAYVNAYADPAAFAGALQSKYRANNQIIPGGGGILQPGGVLQPGQTVGPDGRIIQQQNGLNTQGGTLDLPEGIDQLVAIDPQNIILVYGTAEAVAELQTIIDYLDRPIRQVEIEAQFIDVSVNELRGFGVQFFNGGVPGADGMGGGSSIGTGVPGANQLTISYGQYAAQLSLLAQSGNSRIISSPRVTTMNNLQASLQSSQTTPIVLTSSTTGIGGQVAQAQQAFSLTTSVGIQVTPTILNDDTITVFVSPQVQTQAPTPGLGGGGAGAAPAIPTVLSQQLTTVANVTDSDVIVLGGLRTRSETIANTRIPILSRIPIIGKLFQSRNKTDVDRELVIFLTARIYRRTDNVAPFQGP